MIDKIRNNYDIISTYITKGVMILLFGMVIQFIAHTILVYKIGLPDTGVRGAIRARKELLVLMMGGACLPLLFKKEKYVYILKNTTIKRIIFACLISFIVSGIISIFIHEQSVTTFIVSAKFNYFPLIIGCIGLLIGQIISEEQKNMIIDKCVVIIKGVLIFGLGRYVLLHTFSNGLDQIGYAQPGSSIEWTANTPPPSLWLTEFYTGYVRNQGPFGGPLSFGFWLACLRPLFYAKVLFKKDINKVRGWWLLYPLMVFSTFSRAARGMFIIISILMSIILYRKYLRFIILSGVSFVILIAGYVSMGGDSNMLIRTWSDKGHKEFITEGVELIKNNRLWGLGAASVGPASYHIEGEKVFNPENQYMQIRLEYGIIGIIGWILAYFIFVKQSIQYYWNIFLSQKKITIEDIIDIFPGLAFIGLCIANIVLHPMTDSSSMYPYMIMAGILLPVTLYKKTKYNDIDIKNPSTNLSKKQIFGPIFYFMAIFLSVFFIIQTLIVYGIKILPNTVTASIIRDSIFLSSIAVTLRTYRRYIISYMHQYKTILLSIIGIVLIMLYHIIVGGYEVNNIIGLVAGIKFDIQYMVVLCCGLWVGSLIYHNNEGDKLYTYLQWFAKFIMIVIIAGGIWQISKNIRPDFFTHIMGMSLPRDFIPFSNPPLYYLTGSNGLQRLSGLFVGPNTLGFFMVVFFSFFNYMVRKESNRNFLLSSYIIISILTFSRGAVLGIALQILLLIIDNKLLGFNKPIKTIKRKIIYIIILFCLTCISFRGINQRKGGSNNERNESLHQTISLIAQKPLLGHGPGYVGPGKHYEKDYLTNQKNPFSLVENIYLQTAINQGIIGLILRCTIRISLLLYHRRLSGQTNINNNIIYITQNLGIGLLGLLSIGMFLHVFIDSIVNYLFFMLYGITLSYSIHQSHKKQEI